MNADDMHTPTQDSSVCVPAVDAHERWQRTAVTAFFLAEARGFAPGHELEDWLAAERLVDAALIAVAVPVDGIVAAVPLAPDQGEAEPTRPARKRAAKPSPTGIEPAPKKKAATARKSTSRTRKKPGIEADLGGMA